MRYLLKKAKEIFSVKPPDLEALLCKLEPGPVYLIFVHITMKHKLAQSLARELQKKGISCIIVREEIPPVVYELEIPEKNT